MFRSFSLCVVCFVCRCGYEFCYTCGAEWKDKKATCSCPLWEERNILREQDVAWVDSENDTLDGSDSDDEYYDDSDDDDDEPFAMWGGYGFRY